MTTFSALYRASLLVELSNYSLQKTPKTDSNQVPLDTVSILGLPPRYNARLVVALFASILCGYQNFIRYGLDNRSKCSNIRNRDTIINQNSNNAISVTHGNIIKMAPELAIKNMEELVAPISEDQPAGFDIREDRALDSLYQKIKDARSTARGLERKYSADGDNPLDYWRIVLEIAPEILKTQSKDLDIACWYVEALVRLEGFRGLHDGIELIGQLIEHHWDNLFPMPDEDGLETRVLQLSGLNGRGADGVLIAPIRRVPFTDGDDKVSFWQYQQALEADNIADETEKKKKIDSLEFSTENIEKAVEASKSDFYISQRDDLQSSIEKFREMGKKLDELCGADSPSTSNIINAMQQCLGAIRHLGDKKNKFPIEETVETNEDGEVISDSDTETGAQLGAPASTGSINNRAQAFKQLRLISDFFLKTEPHSPISYALNKTISWGDMSLAELIDELIPEGGSRLHYGLLTGIKNNEE